MRLQRVTETGFLGGYVDGHGGVTAPGAPAWLQGPISGSPGSGFGPRGEGREARVQVLPVEAEGSQKPVLLRGSASGHASLLALVAGSGGIQPSTPVRREGPPRRGEPNCKRKLPQSAPLSSDRKPHARSVPSPPGRASAGHGPDLGVP